MTITIEKQTDVYSRPNARFDQGGTLEIRASAVGNCRRALWYEATGHQVTNPRSDDSITMLEAGNALEPVVLRAMQRAGWDITATDRDNPQMVSLRLGPTLVVSGHVDAAGVAPIFGNEPSIVEVKTRGPEAYKKWRTLGAERSHPESVWQAAFYTYGAFDQARDLVIATLDTGNRVWDYEVIPAPPGGAGLRASLRPAGGTGGPSSGQRARPGRAAGAGLHRRRLAVQTLPLPERLPAGVRGSLGGRGRTNPPGIPSRLAMTTRGRP